MKTAAFFGALALSLVVPAAAQARQYVSHFHGREVVVHTSRVPVVMHRLVPPQHGRHVTERELNGAPARGLLLRGQ